MALRLLRVPSSLKAIQWCDGLAVLR